MPPERPAAPEPARHRFPGRLNVACMTAVPRAILTTPLLFPTLNRRDDPKETR
jgi:hypothetical protein